MKHNSISSFKRFQTFFSNNFELLNSLLILAFLVSGCNKKEKDTGNSTQSFFTINYEAALGNKKQINLDDIAKSVNYIPLQTDSNCLLARNIGIHFTSDYIFAENRDHVLMFDSNGKFIRKIGSPGKGPHEIDFVITLTVLEREKLLIIKTLATSKLLYFNFDGEFVKEVDVPRIFIVFPLNNDILLEYNMCSIGNEDYFFRLTNLNNDTLDFVRNPYKWENHTGIYMMITFNSFQPFYSFKTHKYFKSIHNDTVFTLTGGKIKPAYFIDLGKYLLPIEKRPENPASKAAFELASDKCFYASPFETTGKIFITTSSYKDDLQQNILYDKKSGESVFLVKEQDAAAGFINNIDNGPEFWPEGYVNDNSVYMTVSPAKILELIESEDFKKAQGNDAARKKLTDLAAKINEEDNPIIMTVDLK